MKERRFLIIGVYSKKLDQLFRGAVKLISDFPHTGKPTQENNVRVKILREYLIIYEITEAQIIILTIWHRSRDPEELKKLYQ